MIDEKRIKEILELFSFPRLCGTNGEKKAFNLALEKIKNFNLKFDIQEFTFSTYFCKYYPKILISICYFLLFSFYINISAIIFPILFLISCVILIINIILVQWPEKIKLGRKLKSQNLIINLPYQVSDNKSEISKRNILLFCHLDSKSQKISILARIRAARAWIFSSIALLIIIILKNYFLIQISLILFVIGAIPLAVSSLATILIIYNTTGNKSRGAIDNASGISCVMELLNHYLDPKLRFINTNLCFIFTGAEECGTMGIRHFFQKIKEIDRDNTIILNFDSIARSIYIFPGKPIKKNVKLLIEKFLNNSKKLDIKVFSKRFYIGSRSDGYFLKKKGFQGIGIGDMESYKFIHSVNDTLDKVNPSILKELCEVIITILRDYDTNFNIS
ncbi:MAG: M28 family metallopeptidase [Candidatus Hermodarchaeota archaeon]